MQNKFVMGRWLKVPLTHPVAAAARQQMLAPNPQYKNAEKRGDPIPPDTPKYDILFRETDQYMLVPRAFGEKFITQDRWVDMRANCPVKFPRCTIQIPNPKYPGQQEFVDGILAMYNVRTGIIAEAQTGFGKTVCVNFVLFKLQQRALILVHTEFLMEQWEEQLLAAGLKSSQIGRVQKNRFEYGGRYLVTIGMIQTILKRRKRYPKEFFASFGVVVSDEVHRMGASTFRETITMFNPMFRLGVSATPKRKDGCEAVFEAHIGPVSVVGKKRKMKPTIKEIYTDMQLEERQKMALMRWQLDYRTMRRVPREDFTKVETFLVRHPRRNKRIVKLLVAAVLTGRKTLLLTKRVEHLVNLRKMLEVELRKAGSRSQIGILKGQMKRADWAISVQCPVILGTFGIANEALDIPALDALILATPFGDIVQAVGRILREFPNKKPPVVIDIIDDGIGICEGLARKRWMQYNRMGWVSARHPSRLPPPLSRRAA